MYGIAECNALCATPLYRDRFPGREMPGHRFFANLNKKLLDTGSLIVNREHLGSPGQRIVEN